MATSLSKEEAYLRLKRVFKGELAKVRKGKAIRNAIEKHAGHPEVRELLWEWPFDEVCDRAKELLKDKVFASEDKAQAYFSLMPVKPSVRNLSPMEATHKMNFFNTMMALANERVEIYVSLKDIFKGERAEIQQAKEINDLIKKHKKDPKVRKLLEKYTMERICSSVMVLTIDGFFIREEIAKFWYPQLLSTASTTRTTDTKATPAVAKPSSSAPTDTNGGLNEAPSKNTASPGSTTNQRKRTTDSGVEIPSLFPIMVPSVAQYQVAKDLQETIEASCFKFTKQNLEHILKENGWTCWQQVDPIQWNWVLREAFTQNKLAQRPSQTDFEALLLDIRAIRNLTLTRTRVTGEKFELLVEVVERFSQLLGDEEAQQIVRKLSKDTKLTLRQLKEKKERSELSLQAQLKRIKAAKEALDREEVEAVKHMLDCDKEHVQHTDALLASASRSLSLSEPSPRLMTPSTDSEDDEDVVVTGEKEASERGKASEIPERATTPSGGDSPSGDSIPDIDSVTDDGGWSLKGYGDCAKGRQSPISHYVHRRWSGFSLPSTTDYDTFRYRVEQGSQ